MSKKLKKAFSATLIAALFFTVFNVRHCQRPYGAIMAKDTGLPGRNHSERQQGGICRQREILYPTGDVFYDGELKDGMSEGEGTYYDPEGNILEIN